jgi:iron complex outermembrane receptor protein
MAQGRPHPPAPPPRLPRRTRTAATFSATALLLAATLYGGSALADARTDARRHFRAGMALIEKKQLVDGIKELELAYQLAPHPNVAYNIAVAQAELGNLELAIGAYGTYLDSKPPDQAEVEGTIQKLREKLAAKRAAAEAKPSETPEPAIDKPGEKPGDKPGDKPIDKPGEKPGDKPGDKPIDKPGEKPVAKPGDKPVAKPGGEQPIGGGERTDDIYEETVVTASRAAQSPLDSPSSTTIITKQDIRLSGITRIPELLRRVAGMDVMQITGGDENVSMRGFNSRLANKLLVLVNGRSVYNDILGSTFWETLTIDVDQVERIEVVRGPGSALYGADAFSGVVNIITIAPGEGSKSGVRVGYGDHQQGYASGWVSGRDGDFSYRASAGYTRYPRWTREVAPGRIDLKVADFDQNLGAENLRIDLRTEQRLSKDTAISLGGGYSRVALDVYGTGPFNDYRLKGDTLDVTSAFRSKHINARVYYSRLAVTSGVDYAYIGQSLYEPSHPTQNSFDAELGYTGDFKLPAVLKHTVNAGVGYRFKNISWEYLEKDTPNEHHGSIYLQDAISYKNLATLVVSGRLDYVPYLARVVPSPRASFILKPSDRQAVRVSGSTAFRSPTFLESHLALPIQLPLPGAELISASKREDDPNFKLQPEQITAVEASYLNQQSDLFEFEVTAYYNRVTDLVALAVNRNNTLSTKGAGLPGYDVDTGRYNVGFGGWANQCDTYNVGGGELGARVYPVEGLDIFANYALNLSSQDRPTGCSVPEDKRTSTHKANVGVQVRTKVGINGELTFHYQSAQTWNEQVASLAGINYQPYTLPAYTLVNARIGYRFFKDKMEASATVFNALADVFGEAPQMHPFGNRVGRRFMGFFTYSL